MWYLWVVGSKGHVDLTTTVQAVPVSQGSCPALFGNASNFTSETFPTAVVVFIFMHRLARSLVTAASCSKTTSAATRLAANWQRSAAARSTLPWSTSRRTIHVRVPLPYKVEDGMGNFLSPAALKVIAEDYQQGLLDRLNEQIKGKCLRVFDLHEPMMYLLGVRGRV
jgi:hypothetical protein